MNNVIDTCINIVIIMFTCFILIMMINFVTDVIFGV